MKDFILPNGNDLLEMGAVTRLDEPTVDLVQKLKFELSAEAQKLLNQRITSIKCKLLLSSVLLIIGSLTFTLSTAAGLKLYISAPNLKFSFTDFLVLSFFAGITIFGWRIRKTEQSRVNNPLHSNALKFLVPEMGPTYELFFEWARANQLKLFIQLSNNRFVPLSTNIWNKSYADAFILGSEASRRSFVRHGKYSMAPLVILFSDIERCESYIEVKNKAITQADKPDYLQVDDAVAQTKVRSITSPLQLAPAKPHLEQSSTSPNPENNSFSLRQLCYGEHSKRCPRFEMILEDPIYVKRYFDKGIERNSLRPTKTPYYDMMRLFEENFDELPLVFNNKSVDENDKKVADELLRKMRHALQVTETRNIHLFTNFKKKIWLAFEKYIEREDIISDEELAKKNKRVREYLDSQD